MPARNVVLTDHREALVARLVASGRYRNAGEVLREGLRLVELEQPHDEIRLRPMREAAGAGIAAGRFRMFDAADALQDRLSALAEEAIAGVWTDTGEAP